MTRPLRNLSFAAGLVLSLLVTTSSGQQPLVGEAPSYSTTPGQSAPRNYQPPSRYSQPYLGAPVGQPTLAPGGSPPAALSPPASGSPTDLPRPFSGQTTPWQQPPVRLAPFQMAPPQLAPGQPQQFGLGSQPPPAIGNNGLAPGAMPAGVLAQSISLQKPHPADNLDLDRLSDEELIDLYIATQHAESPRRDVFDESSLVVPDSLLVQVGYTYSYDLDDADFRNDQHTYPELLVRYRLLPRLELRLAWAGVTVDTLTDELTGLSDTDNRTADISIGGRLALWEQNGWAPRTSVTFASPFDLESDANLFDRMDPLASVGYSWIVHERWLVAGSSGAVWNREGSERYLDFQQSLSAIYFLNDYSDISLTWSGIFPEGSRIDGMAHSIGPGISHSLTDRLQIDLSTGFGVDEASPDFLVQTFLTWRK